MDDYDDDDVGFVGYIPTTVDPGLSMLIGATVFCILTNLMLPCLVSLGRRYEMRRLAFQQREGDAADNCDGKLTEAHNKQSEGVGVEAFKDGAGGGVGLHDDAASVAPSSFVHGSAMKKTPSAMGGGIVQILDKIVMPPYPDDQDGSVIAGSAFHPRRTRHDARSTVSGMSLGQSSVAGMSSISNASTSFLDAGFGRRGGRSRAIRRQRRALMDVKLRLNDKDQETMADAQAFGGVFRVGEVTDEKSPVGTGATSSPASFEKPQSEVGSRVAGSELTRGRPRRRNQAGSTISGARSSRRGGSPEPSILSELDDHVISPNDAADANDPGNYILPTPGMEGDDDFDFCCGKHAWWSPSMLAAGFDRIVDIAEYDFEMKRIVKLALPFSMAALLVGVFETVQVAFVANFIGTNAVAAFTIVELVTGMTTEFVAGIIQSEATLCSHALGAGNHKLAGQYVQLCAILYTVLVIPNIIIWLVFVDDVILLFGFDQNVADIGQKYAGVFLFHGWISGVKMSLDGLLEVMDHEYFVSFMEALEYFVATALVAVVLSLRETTLQEVAMINLGVSVFFFIFVCCFAFWSGWLGPYLEGMLGSNAFRNKTALLAVIKTGLPLAFGYLLAYGEWEILSIFAAFLGPAEVAAWGILGYLWETFEALTEGIADGGEVRVSYHLGADDPAMARLAAYKTILIAVIMASFFTSIIFIMGEDLATWLTNDPALQHLIAEILPLVGVGNITLTSGTVCWALVGAQGRYRLATFVAFVGSWVITTPLAALFTYGFNINLQGITAAVVVGYSVIGTILTYVLLRSDWDRLSKIISELNAKDVEEMHELRAANAEQPSASSSSSSSAQ